MNAPLAISPLWGLDLADLVVIGIYFLVTLYIGYRARKGIRNQTDYFLGGRKFGKWIQTFAAFGQATSVESVTATSTLVAANGAAGIWANLAGGLFNMPVLWMTTIWYRRLRLLTLADFFEDRYGSRAMAAVYTACQAVFLVMVAAFGLTAMSKTVAAIAAKPATALTAQERSEYDRAVQMETLDAQDYAALAPDSRQQLLLLHSQNPRKEFSYVNEDWLIVIVAIITLAYTIGGGLEAAFVTDLLQGSCILVLTVLLVPFAVARINHTFGGEGFVNACRNMHAVLPASAFELWGSPNLPELTWYWIAAFSLMGLLNTAVQSNQLTACGSAKDEETARSGFVAGIFLKRYSNVLWGFVAMMAFVLYGTTIRDPDYLWGHASRDLLSPARIGLVGLMIACLMAALMASKSAMMLTASALLTHSVYAPINPGKSERHYIRVGQAFNIFYMVASVLVATYFKSVFGLFKFIAAFNSILAASFWLGMVWRRANRWGAWSSIAITILFTAILPFGIPLIPGIRESNYLAKTTAPLEVARTYHASAGDVSAREVEIQKWNSSGASPKPQSLIVGQMFQKMSVIPPHSIFWSDNLKTINGRSVGQGYLKVELVFLDMLGWDLAKNRYAVNETMTMVARIVVPIGVLMIVSLLTPRDSRQRVDRFYGKMRTQVRADAQADTDAMAATHADPHRFDHLKLFPKSNWEFRRWDASDLKGVIGASLMALGCVALLIALVRIGS